MASAQDRAPADFQPGDISIGEPIALPFGKPQPPATLAPAPATAVPARAGQAGQAVPGSGWLGMAVAESNVPGRWRIDDVVPNGPAARAGILVGDELRAVNGIPLRNADEVSQTFTAIAAEQDVRVAIARADQVMDISLKAEPRPAPVRGWQPADAGPAAVTSPPATAAPPATASVADPQPATTPPNFRTTPAAPPPALSASTSPASQRGEPVARSVVVPDSGPAAMLPPPSVAAPSVATTPRSVDPSPTATERRGRTALGVRTLPIDSGIQARFHLPEQNGAYVIGVVQDLPASKAGVPPGSVIVALDNRPVRSPIELANMVSSGPVDRPVTLQFVLPGGESKRAEVVLQSLEAPLERVLVGAPEPTASAPTLEPGPTARRAERPASPAGEAADAPLQDEVRWLRSRLERLERRLEALTSPGR